MTEDIVQELSKIRALKSFPRSEMLAFRDKPVTAPQVGENWGPCTCSKGLYSPSGQPFAYYNATRREHDAPFCLGGALRPANGRRLRPFQEEISLSIAKALESPFRQEEKVIAKKPTANAQAYDSTLRGRNYLRQRAVRYAAAMYQEAVKLDPISRWPTRKRTRLGRDA